MELLLKEFLAAFQGYNLLIMFLATIVGTIIGAIPGLTVNMAIALAIPLTIYLPLAPSLSMLFALYCSGIFGGSISAILINTPGTPASAATTFDGYPMAQQGKAGKALQMALFASFIGGIFSLIMLMLIAPQLANFALKFGPAERSTLLLFALTIVGVISGESILKGLLAGSMGLVLATVGVDPMLNAPRFTFGLTDLEDGFNYIALLIGLFAISEMLINAEDRMQTSVRVEYKKSTRKEDNHLTWSDIVLSWKTLLRSSLLGTFIGIMPGIGAAVACFFGYGEAKRASKHPEAFGKGTVEGVAASEAANNAVTGSALIPLLSLSIPGDAVTAILYGALLIQGITPGPLIFQQHLEAVYLIYITLTLANIFMVITNLSFMPFFVRVTEIPRKILFPIVFIFCAVGSFAIRNNIFDVYIMLIFGMLGYFLRKFMIPLAPMLIAFILAKPFEESLQQSLLGSEGSLKIFISSPLSIAFLLLTILSILVTGYRNLRKASKKTRGFNEFEEKML